MRYLTIMGEKKVIPPYPHHKDYIYRNRKFFKSNNLIGLVNINGPWYALRKIWLQWKYKFPIPYVILLDPTTACNLKCKGCWAADYDSRSELSYEKMDEILTEARKLGVQDISFTGGEPLMRKKDLLKLFSKHRFTFTIYSNGTLIDEKFASDIARLGNVNILISIEGFRENTDFRRGEGTFDRVVKGMENLRKYDIGFGFSTCYHSKNYKEVCSDGFFDFMREKGAWFGWMLNYLPLGKDADASLCLTAEQRRYVLEKTEAYSKKQNFTIVDFANTGHLYFGCVAAANEFIHINAKGDVEPCAFFHYSDVNINDMTLTEALNSKFFRHFRKFKPFSENPYRPCPIMDVPEALAPLTNFEGVKSTHLDCEETVEELYAKTKPVADQWKPVADELYERMSETDREKIRFFRKYLLYRER